ncbi:MAG: hypothetical protein EXR89_04265 [Methylococcaceae bacterium]|nr:hypothetical protein [Methylococcaceae bacterium]
MAKISLESTDTTLYVSGPSIFSVSKTVENDPIIDFKIFLETRQATADLSNIGNAASHTFLSLPGKSTDYSQFFKAKLGIIRILDTNNLVVANLPIAKGTTTSNVQLHFADYLPDTNVYLSKSTGTSKALVLDSQPNLLPIVKLTSNPANVTEGDKITYTAKLDHQATTDLDIPYTLSGAGITTADFTNLASLTGVIHIAKGETTKSFTLKTVDDGQTEIAESLSVKLSTVAGAKVHETPANTLIAKSVSPNQFQLGNLPVQATSAQDFFTFDFQMVSGRVTKATTGEVTITDFNPLIDKLVFNDVGIGTVYTEAQFILLPGVVISENPFTNNTTIYVDPLAGASAGVTIVGILDENLTKITLETTV